jgi:formylglycine-generating enzyme required for sulfatase activity
MRTKILLLAAVIAFPLLTMANNIRVVLNSYNPATKQLKISLAWDNSWHDGSGQFRDAAWLFVKYKDITNNEWQHAVLATPSSTAVLSDTLSGSNVKFNLIGRNPSVAPGPVGSRGYMIRRQKGATAAVQNNPEFAGVYNVGMPLTATIVLPAGVTLANPEFRVYALEMVNIPAGSFYAGDGTTSSMVKTSDSNNSPFLLTSETVGITPYIYNNTIAIPAGTSTAPTYPRGVNEYFIMKYELSLDGYHEYLNTLTRTQQNNQLAASPTEASGTVNYGLTVATYTSQTNPAVFSCDANNNGIFNEANDGKTNGALMSYVRAVLGYLDWAAIRPMTGFEYEKACRGPLYPVANEAAWGSNIYNVVNLDIDRFGPNETNSVVLDGPIFNGSIRNGAFAKANGSTRLNSGGSYYGVMELSNGGHSLSTGFSETGFGWTSFTGTNGDGMVNPNYTGMYLHQHGSTVSNGIFYWEENFNYSAYGQGWFEIRGVIK